ncbi:UDP-2,3-diacylglucosamine diphosphatase [Legionella spiritensis]|uniref:UDP-2,3-diacylglucosamine hydrolase n=1 Tax=Legionella spiritensis TaxID=452 RepID=A0A0W0YXJ5_LEGSP|nr:UDP-2,3-diacylglucosamine diphosphatase [Legionella spiritensis]KTD61604.1 UDP-2,3-diacylglucosamine hydrolase [Legionella spiritensis]SNV39461.1 UDP-2,3-diacylglucosamine hydrolase [Legionella spiritensis]
MLDAVFISDLHLHPEHPDITSRFQSFMAWAVVNTRTLYILGDFFHVWPGDDGMDSWSLGIARMLREAAEQGLTIYYMHGNRDFLLGKAFAAIAGMVLLKDPAILHVSGESVLLSHGDSYCTLDKGHQRFRRLTRNRLFVPLFLLLPYRYRNRMVNHVRQRSQQHRGKDPSVMDVVPQAMLPQLAKWRTTAVIHGHTHKPGITRHEFQGRVYQQYVLSDWDDRPTILCYHHSKGFEFSQSIVY